MHSYHNKLLPYTFNTTFVTNRQVHTYNTRHANNYRPYFCRTNIKQFTILHLGPKLWNSLSHIQPPPPPPIQRKKVIKPSTPPLIILLFTVLINLDCKTSCGLIRDGLFTNWQFGLVIDHQLRDLQLLVLNRELFTLYSNSFGRTDSIVFDKLNKPPSLISRPRLY